MFKLLALVLLGYAGSVARKGQVTIRDEGGSRTIYRDEAPALLWFHVGAYAAAAVALAMLP
ncbi:MAG: hypothetical protein J7485_12095 [Sphingobium sp.]|nr:hypothetical protein [Sphingobium sp.]